MIHWSDSETMGQEEKDENLRCWFWCWYATIYAVGVLAWVKGWL